MGQPVSPSRGILGWQRKLIPTLRKWEMMIDSWLKLASKHHAWECTVSLLSPVCSDMIMDECDKRYNPKNYTVLSAICILEAVFLFKSTKRNKWKLIDTGYIITFCFSQYVWTAQFFLSIYFQNYNNKNLSFTKKSLMLMSKSMNWFQKFFLAITF